MKGKRILTFTDFGSVKALAENYDVECKLAAAKDGRGQFPVAALESYSAFANTEGGWIVLGVKETKSGMVVSGIEDTDRVQKQLFDALNNREQVSRNMLTDADVEVVEQESVSQFRNVFQSISPDHPFLAGSDLELLRSVGGLRRNRDTGDEHLTVAGLLMFGSLASIRERFPHYNLDYQEQHRSPERWAERVTTDGRWPGNLFRFYRKVVLKLFDGLRAF